MNAEHWFSETVPWLVFNFPVFVTQRTDQTCEGLRWCSHGARGEQMWPPSAHSGHEASPGTGPLLWHPLHWDLCQNTTGSNTPHTTITCTPKKNLVLLSFCFHVFGINFDHPKNISVLSQRLKTQILWVFIVCNFVHVFPHMKSSEWPAVWCDLCRWEHFIMLQAMSHSQVTLAWE